MAIGNDRVQVTKKESSALGGDDSDAGLYGEPVPINPQEDAIESAGIYLQDETVRDEQVGLFRHDGKLMAKDTENPTGANLTQMLEAASVGHPFKVDSGESLVVPQNRQFDHLGRFLTEGRLVIDGRFTLGIGAPNV